MLEPVPHDFFGIVSFVKGGLVRLVGMFKVRVKKNLRKVTGALRAFVTAIEMDLDKNVMRKCPISNPYKYSIVDVIPCVPMCFDSGLPNL